MHGEPERSLPFASSCCSDEFTRATDLQADVRVTGGGVRGVWQLDIPVEVVHTVPGDVAHWEHEVFARAGLRAATLSARRMPPPSLARSSVLDCGSAAVNATSVSRTVRLVRAAASYAGECA